MTQQTALTRQDAPLPPILAGAVTPDVRRRVERFFFSVAEIFEAWVTSVHTQRSYRADVLSFVGFFEARLA